MVVRIPEPGQKPALARHMDPAAEEEAESLSGLEHVRQEPPARSPQEGKLVIDSSSWEFQVWVESTMSSCRHGLDSGQPSQKTNPTSCHKLRRL